MGSGLSRCGAEAVGGERCDGGLYTAMALVGQTIGNLLFGWMGDRYGHKRRWNGGGGLWLRVRRGVAGASRPVLCDLCAAGSRRPMVVAG